MDVPVDWANEMPVRLSSPHSTIELYNHRDLIQSSDREEDRTDGPQPNENSMSLDDFFNFISMPPVSVRSPYAQTDEPMITGNIASDPPNLPSVLNGSTEHKATRSLAYTDRKILRVSKLKTSMTKNDLRRHFVGSTKVILKQHDMFPSLQ